MEIWVKVFFDLIHDPVFVILVEGGDLHLTVDASEKAVAVLGWVKLGLSRLC